MVRLTGKVLLGISPGENISFVSDVWDGRASDRHITLNSNIIEHIEPGDQIMADRDIDIKEDVAMRRADLIIPTATREDKQMADGDGEATKEIASMLKAPLNA